MKRRNCKQSGEKGTWEEKHGHYGNDFHGLRVVFSGRRYIDTGLSVLLANEAEQLQQSGQWRVWKGCGREINTSRKKDEAALTTDD